MKKAAAAIRIADQTYNLLPFSGSPTGERRINNIMVIARAPPLSKALISFTDGSALGNPGPAGAGAFCSYPTLAREGHHPSQFAICLGKGDNNLGEMVGIFIGLQFFLHCFKRECSCFPLDFPAFLFSDSLCCISYLIGNWPAPTHQELSRATRKLYHELCDNHPNFRIYWVKAHDSIELNEAADHSAKIGSMASESLKANSTIIIEPDFNSPVYKEFADFLTPLENKTWG